ncbi:hypothetical protein BG011_004422 [Mortierella polycephala]|uniref:Uncharacterized protein n=1 Tax=Mortierella polycephala TaxID=41804 RepID=A0A9P6Q1L8_9FUNG|nr:hypothetical protein BG011_004422 [Mortierella polycephala]
MDPTNITNTRYEQPHQQDSVPAQPHVESRAMNTTDARMTHTTDIRAGSHPSVGELEERAGCTALPPAAFTTTDASGYPDKLDGLSACNPQYGIQDPHEHHKHLQVQDPTFNQHELGHNTAGREQHEHSHAVDKPPVEVAKDLFDPELRQETGVPNFKR